jgi:hypothetical protein
MGAPVAAELEPAVELLAAVDALVLGAAPAAEVVLLLAL